KVLTIEEKKPEKPATSTLEKPATPTPTPGDNEVPDDNDNEEPDDKPNTPTADSAPLALLGALSLGSLVLMKNRKLNNK
ncbi:MAG: sortase B protein-sorting domain-containing protein, partial [Clostridium sp.]|nr:sortase B protein-sorting domain-containing protein [Clostridium sp.]